MTKSIRKLTDQQFTDGTTIDGNRIEEALQDLQQRMNRIPKGDIKHRWTQTQFCINFASPRDPDDDDVPSKQSIDSRYPFVSVVNDERYFLGAGSELNIFEPEFKDEDETDYEIVNRLRIKGAFDSQLNRAYTAQTTLFSRPAILRGINFLNWAEGRRYTSLTSSWLLIVHLDNAYAPENRELNQKLIFVPRTDRNNQNTLYYVINPTRYTPQYVTDGSEGNTVSGTIVDLNRLHINIPAGGRIRFAIVRQTSRVAANTKFSATLTFLEEIE